MANKVSFGLANVKYAIYDATNKTYGALKDFKGAVSLSMTREGGDSSDFYADNGVFYTFAGTNGGYSADLEMALITDAVRQDLLGEIVDAGTGVQFERSDVEAPEFALIFETSGDTSTTGFVLYNCKASRPEMNANTKNDSPEVDTGTLSLRIGQREFTFRGTENVPFVQGHIEKTSENTAKYAAFFTSVVLPTATAA